MFAVTFKNWIFIVTTFVVTCSIMYYSILGMKYNNLWEYLTRNGLGDREANFNVWQELRRNIKNSTCFFLLSGLLIWFSLVGLAILPTLPMSNLLSRIIATGIHVPFVFLICGWIIRGLQKLLLQKWMISEKEVKQSLVLITVCLDILLLVINWEMALFVAAIISGKYIWFDSVFNPMKLRYYIDNARKTFTFNNLDEEDTGLGILFGQIMLFSIAFGIIGTIIGLGIIYLVRKG